jgi:hypothetical protein
MIKSVLILILNRRYLLRMNLLLVIHDTIKSWVQIWGGLSIEDNVFKRANIISTNDQYLDQTISRKIFKYNYKERSLYWFLIQ